MNEIIPKKGRRPIPNNHEEAAASILEKVKSLYKPLAIAPTELELLKRQEMIAKAEEYMNGINGWDPKKCKLPGDIVPDDQTCARLTAICHPFMEKVIDSQILAEKINSLYNIKYRGRRLICHNSLNTDEHDQDMYKHSRNANSLIDTYTTHLLLATVEKIHKLGYTPTQAYGMCGKIIQKSFDAYQNGDFRKLCAFAPQRIPELNSEENFKFAQGYWLRTKKYLEERNRVHEGRT